MGGWLGRVQRCTIQCTMDHAIGVVWCWSSKMRRGVWTRPMIQWDETVEGPGGTAIPIIKGKQKTYGEAVLNGVLKLPSRGPPSSSLSPSIIDFSRTYALSAMCPPSPLASTIHPCPMTSHLPFTNQYVHPCTPMGHGHDDDVCDGITIPLSRHNYGWCPPFFFEKTKEKNCPL